MATVRDTSDRVVRTAASLYIIPRAANAILVLALIGLAGFMIFGALALSFLRQLGS